MSQPKYLKNRKTGVVFPYSELLAKRGDMVPADSSAAGAQTQAEPEPAVSKEPADDEVMIYDTPLSKAKKADILKYAEEELNNVLNKDQGVAELREQVEVLVNLEG